MIRARLGRSRIGAAALAVAMALAFVPAQAQLPTLGDGSDLTAAAERRIGEKVARELFRDPDYIDDPVVSEYVQGIWQRLLDAARTRGDLVPELEQRFAWQILLGKDRSINAFAVPGGWLGLHLGLVAVTTTRDELASVLAHELSHVTQRHISRLISQDKRQSPLMIGAMILGALAASKNPSLGNAVITGGTAIAAQGQLNFSRDMEREADRIGFGILSQAGFSPRGFVSMFEKLQQAQRLNDNGAFPYLRTHPMQVERAADMQSRQMMVDRAPPAAADLEHLLVAARARVQSATGVDALRALQREAQSLPASADRTRAAPVLYASVLASAKLRDTSAMQRDLGRLQVLTTADARAERLVRLLAAEAALQTGDAATAAKLVRSGTGSRAETLLAAQAAIDERRPAAAAEALQSWTALHPDDGTAWQMLASASAAQGQTLRAIRAEAEAQVAWLDYAAALDRLRAAQGVARRGVAAGEHIEASIIDTRTRQVESLLREQSLER